MSAYIIQLTPEQVKAIKLAGEGTIEVSTTQFQLLKDAYPLCQTQSVIILADHITEFNQVAIVYESNGLRSIEIPDPLVTPKPDDG